MSHGRNQQITEGPAIEYPPALPELRRRVIIRDFDFGERELVVNLYRCPRIDCYMVEIDGEIVDGRAGWSTALEIIRGKFPRLRMI